MNIDSRVDLLLADRTAAELSRHYGLNRNWEKSVRDRKGTYKLIWPLIRGESLRPEWLLSGMGQPYRVNHWFNAEQMRSAVQVMLEQGGWSVFLLGADGVILWRYAGLQPDDEHSTMFVDYQAHFGPINAQLIEDIRAGAEYVQFAHLSADVIAQVKTGQIGTYRLFGYPTEKPGYLSEDKRWPTLKGKQLDEYYQRVIKTKAPLSPDERELMSIFRDLDESQQAAVWAVIDSYRDK